MGYVLSGADGGEVWWGYHRAARVSAWSITSDSADLTLTGTVTEVDAFRLSQSALTFRVIRQNGSVWEWPIRSLHHAGDSLLARLDP